MVLNPSKPKRFPWIFCKILLVIEISHVRKFLLPISVKSLNANSIENFPETCSERVKTRRSEKRERKTKNRKKKKGKNFPN